jgi:hypothetical protein
MFDLTKIKKIDIYILTRKKLVVYSKQTLCWMHDVCNTHMKLFHLMNVLNAIEIDRLNMIVCNVTFDDVLIFLLKNHLIIFI